MTKPVSSLSLRFAAAPYLGLSRVTRIRGELDIALADHSYLPHPEDPARDWVASVATPAFRLIREKEGPLPAFASIGTGSGIDALAAIEVMGALRVGITDLHTDVVEGAAANIRRNLREGVEVKIEAGVGDLLSPLRDRAPLYDLIYENLPNVALPEGGDLAEERSSSGHVARRREAIPELIRKNLVELHFLALVQSREFLAPKGSVIATIGARIPLSVFVEMGRLAGFSSTIHAYGWKTQDTPEEMLRRYDEQQKEGYGPFTFYRAEVLRRVFADIDFAASGNRAAEIEKLLAPHRLDATAAYAAFRLGDEIGHTVAVVRSRPA
jgi:hypothetical protein